MQWHVVGRILAKCGRALVLGSGHRSARRVREVEAEDAFVAGVALACCCTGHAGAHSTLRLALSCGPVM